MKRQVVSRTQTITANTTLMPEGYAGFLAKNIGTGNVKVDGFVLEPGDELDLTSIPADVIWNSPLPIEVESNGVLRIMRLKYNIING